jgi:phospholipid transport system substrate-binding protein
MVTRRAVLAGTAALALIAAMGSIAFERPALAQDQGAAAFLDGMARQAIGVLQTVGTGTAEGRAQFAQIFEQGFDVPTIGRFVLGRYWNTATQEQQQEYLQLFQQMVVSTYARRFQNYQGESLQILGTRAAGDQGDVLVQTQISQSNGPPIAVDWRVRSRSGGYKVVDVIVANVSMSVTQRDEFASVIVQNGGSIEGLLAALRQRAAG